MRSGRPRGPRGGRSPGRGSSQVVPHGADAVRARRSSRKFSCLHPLWPGAAVGLDVARGVQSNGLAKSGGCRSSRESAVQSALSHTRYERGYTVLGKKVSIEPALGPHLLQSTCGPRDRRRCPAAIGTQGARREVARAGGAPLPLPGATVQLSAPGCAAPAECGASGTGSARTSGRRGDTGDSVSAVPEGAGKATRVPRATSTPARGVRPRRSPARRPRRSRPWGECGARLHAATIPVSARRVRRRTRPSPPRVDDLRAVGRKAAPPRPRDDQLSDLAGPPRKGQRTPPQLPNPDPPLRFGNARVHDCTVLPRPATGRASRK